MNTYSVINIFAIISVGLMAGLFYNWSFNITSGLGKLDNKGYLNMMQILNRSILNPAFFLIFLGSIIVLPTLTFLKWKMGMDMTFWLVTSATIVYLLGVLGTTVFGNVPMNNELETLNLNQLGANDFEAFRNRFESRWNRLNSIRTISSLISFVLLTIQPVSNLLLSND